MKSILRVTVNIDKDAFSSGQIGSKLWLCQRLESFLLEHQKHEGNGYIIWVYGGWVGLLPFLLFSRGNVPIQRIVCFDRDRDSLQTSKEINENWFWQGKYRAIEQDLALLKFAELQSVHQEPAPHVVINTAVEHMPNRSWFDSIPPGKALALQSTNMKHSDHLVKHESQEDLERDFPFTLKMHADHLHFNYGNDSSFTRFMIIGFK